METWRKKQNINYLNLKNKLDRLSKNNGCTYSISCKGKSSNCFTVNKILKISKQFWVPNEYFSYEVFVPWTEDEIIHRRLSALYSDTKKRAKQKGLDFDLELTDLFDLFIKSNKKCPISGISFFKECPKKYFRNPYNASVDRIDSSKGYTLKNIRLVSCFVNLCKNEWDDSVFNEFMKGIYANT